MLHVLVPLIAGFRARYPEVELELNSNEGIIDLLERRTDVAFRIGVLKDSTLHARPVGISRIRVLASPAYLKRHGMPASPTQLSSTACWALPSPNRSTTGRCATPTATPCAFARTLPPPAARHCGKWRWPAWASSACRTS
jgi:DNA-binding transcriptional LysR family regulator